MSRSFATTNRVDQGTAALPTTGFIAFWYYPTYSIADGVWHELINITGSGGNLFHIAKYSDNNLYAGWYPNAEKRVVTGAVAAGLTQNAWNHILLEWTNSGDTKLYVNNVQAGSTVNNTTTWNTNTFTRLIGNNPSPFTQPASGRIAELVIGSTVPVAADRTLLLDYKAPNSIAATLVDYLPLVGDSSTEVNGAGGTAGTVTGATQAAHPPMKYPLTGELTSVAYGTRTNTTLTAPANISDGDLLILGFLIGAATPPTPTLPSGFTVDPDFPSSSTVSGFTLTTRIATKIASGESGNYTITHSSASSQAFMLRVPGGNGATPEITKNQGTGATTTATGVTSTLSNALPIFVGVSWDGYLGSGSPPSGTTPTYVERYDENEFYVASGTMFAPGATGNDSNTSTNIGSSPNTGIMILVERTANTTNADATGSSSLTFTVTGVGSTLYSGTGSSSLTFTVTGAGSTLYSSTGSSSLAFTCTAVGSSLIESNGTSSIVFSAAAIGSTLASSTGTSSIEFRSDAIGSTLFDGTGSSSLVFTTLGTGSTLASAVGDSSIAFTANAVGESTADAVGTSSLTFTCSGSSSEIHSRRAETNRAGTRLLV